MNDVLLVALSGFLLLVIGGGVGWWLNGRVGSRSLESARRRSEELVRSARRDADKARRTAMLQAREEILKQRRKSERDYRSRQGQLLKREKEIKLMRQGLADVEADLGRRGDAVKAAEDAAARREADAEQTRKDAERLIEEENRRLERVSGMTPDDAKRQLLQNLEGEARHEAASMVRAIKDEAKRSAETEAVKILSLAIERTASDLSAERSVSQFQLPEGGQLKGRIIGQEGKNIRAFEKATGIQLLLDEHADTVTLSGFHPVRREIARRVLEILVRDGNIHPRRIEDLVRRNRRRLDEEMRRAGEQTVRELGLKGVHGEMVKLLGRLLYRTSYGQNVLLHSKEVAYLTGIMAAELRLDEKLARRAGLFHDIGKAIDYEREGTHPEIGAEVATKFGEPPIVINAIASHHEDCEVTSPISVLVAAADALSGARPGARRKSVAEYIKRIEQLEGLANSMDGVEQSYALQAGREIRVIARSNAVDDNGVEMLASDLAERIQTEMDYPGKIKVTVIREVRAVDHAR